MSAPDKSLKKQKKRHWGPLVGMALAVAVAVGLLFWWLGRELVIEPAANDDAAPAQIEGSEGIPAEGDATGPIDGTGAPQVIEPDQSPEE